DAGLVKLGGAVLPLTENGAHIGEGGRLARRLGDIVRDDGQGELGAQAIFGAGGIGGQQKAPPEFFTSQIEIRIGVEQQRRRGATPALGLDQGFELRTAISGIGHFRYSRERKASAPPCFATDLARAKSCSAPLPSKGREAKEPRALVICGPV